MIKQAAAKIMSSGDGCKSVCLEMGVNLDSHGKYIGPQGADYKSLQTALRTLRRQAVNKILGNKKGSRQQKVVRVYMLCVACACVCICV